MNKSRSSFLQTFDKKRGKNYKISHITFFRFGRHPETLRITVTQTTVDKFQEANQRGERWESVLPVETQNATEARALDSLREKRATARREALREAKRRRWAREDSF